MVKPKNTEVERKKAVSVHSKAGLTMPVTKIRNAMRGFKRGTIKKVGLGAGIAMASLLE